MAEAGHGRLEPIAKVIRKAKAASREVEKAEADLEYKRDNPFGYRLAIKEARRKADHQYIRLAKRGYNPDGIPLRGVVQVRRREVRVGPYRRKR